MLRGVSTPYPENTMGNACLYWTSRIVISTFGMGSQQIDDKTNHQQGETNYAEKYEIKKIIGRPHLEQRPECGKVSKCLNNTMEVIIHEIYPVCCGI